MTHGISVVQFGGSSPRRRRAGPHEESGGSGRRWLAACGRPIGWSQSAFGQRPANFHSLARANGRAHTSPVGARTPHFRSLGPARAAREGAPFGQPRSILQCDRRQEREREQPAGSFLCCCCCCCGCVAPELSVAAAAAANCELLIIHYFAHGRPNRQTMGPISSLILTPSIGQRAQ